MNKMIILALGLVSMAQAAEKTVVKTEVKTMTVTAYCACPKCCGAYGWGYQTANGHKIKHGDRFVAAPKGIAFGTLILIPGYNDGRFVPVLDRGGAIKGNRLDVYFDDHKTALRWGVKKVKVTIQHKGSAK